MRACSLFFVLFGVRPREIFSLHSHQTIIRKSIYTLYFYGRPSEKDREAGLLAPNQKNKNVYVLYFFDCLYEKTCEARLLALFLKLIIIIFCFIWGEAEGDFLPHSHQFLDAIKKGASCSLQASRFTFHYRKSVT